MTSFTRLGTGLWDWEPFNSLPCTERVLWLALYTSAEAKRVLPGLFHGSPGAMADAAHLPYIDTVNALDSLLQRGTVEYDQKHRVLRLTELPDGGDWPTSPNHLHTWWRRFQTVPACAVRDAHVTTLRWILDRGTLESALQKDGANRSSGKPSDKHELIWAETFGTIVIPSSRRRGIRRVQDAQASLFDPDIGSTSPSEPDDLPPGSSPKGKEQVSGPIRHGSAVTGCPTEHPIPASPPSDDPKIKNSGSWDPIPDGIADPIGMGQEKEIENETEKETEIFLSSSGEGGSGGEVPPPTVHAPSPPATDVASGKPRLVLVPMPNELCTPEQLVATLADGLGGKFANARDIREDCVASLQRVISDLHASGIGLSEVLAAGRWLARGQGGIGQIPGDPRSRLSVWAAAPGNIEGAVRSAREHERLERERLELLAESKRTLGIRT